MPLPPLSTAILTVLVFLASALYASVGHAGASGDIAAMGLVGVPTASMKPIALILNLFVASIATYKFYRSGYFSWSLFWPFALTSVPTAFVGGRISLPSHLYRPLVGFVLLYAAYRLVRLNTRPSNEATKEVPLIAAVSWGAAIGLLSGLTGVGGGIFLSPLLLLARWAEVRQSAGVSAAFILVNSIAGLAGSYSTIHQVPSLVLWLIPAAAVGGFVGSYLGSKRLNPATLRVLLAAALVIAAVKMISPI
jgi:uncharacterized membrane protein YfcA